MCDKEIMFFQEFCQKKIFDTSSFLDTFSKTELIIIIIYHGPCEKCSEIIVATNVLIYCLRLQNNYTCLSMIIENENRYLLKAVYSFV